VTDRTWDAAVIGGGPAGLSSALWLARYRRSVLVLDDGRPRNEAAWAVHGYPALPDPDPEALRRRIRDQAQEAGAAFDTLRAAGIDGGKDSFRIELEEGPPIMARRVVLAYGRQDRVPDLPGIRELYGRSVFHCPDCDGPGVVGARVAVLGHDRDAAALALYLLTWAERVALLTNGLEPDLTDDAREVLERNGVAVITRAVHALESRDGALREARFDQGAIALDALFFHWGSDPTSRLGPTTGCECDDGGRILVDPRTMETSVPGVYAAGDIVGRPYLAITAASDGVRAALAIHRSLLPPEFEL
jgi:thioredoxin reductase